MSRVEISDDWEAPVTAAWIELASKRLGPDIAADAKRYCPEKTGALKESIENHMDGETLIVSATGGADGRTYAVYVECGALPHEILPNEKKALFWEGAMHPVRRVNHPGNKPEPYLRPALFTQRGE